MTDSVDREGVASFSRALIVLARAPAPGQVKTRLAAHLGDEATARLYACFVRDTLTKLRALPGSQLLVYYAPCSDETYELLRSLVPTDLPCRLQTGATFGDRLYNALRECAQCERTVLVGTDSPSLPPEFISAAYDALEDRDVVLGPATDGGYYLLGVRRVVPALFEGIDWSTSRVLAQTVQRCEELGLRLALLPPWYDVDKLDDLHFLAGHAEAMRLAEGECPCPHTCAALPDLLGST